MEHLYINLQPLIIHIGMSWRLQMMQLSKEMNAFMVDTIT